MKVTNAQELTARIKQLREEIGLTQIELADKLKISNSAIAMYETDKREPSDDLKIKMSELFDCSIDYLLGKTDIRNPGKQIDNVLNEAMIGMSAKEYDSLSENTKNAIKNFAIYMKEQEEGDKK